MLFRIQGQLDHPLKEFVRLQPREVVTNEFFTKQTANITELTAFLFAGIYEVPVTVIDDDHIFINIES